MSELRPTKEIAVIKTTTKVLAFVDKLREVPLERYGQIHANAETVNGQKVYSLIGITLDDHTKGTGANTVRTSFNVSPELISFILSRLNAGFQDFKYENSKIYGQPDATGRSKVDKISITRSAVDKNGKPYNNPWNIFISNGTGIMVKNNTTGGTMIKANSFIAQSTAFIRLTDFDMFRVLKRVDSFIRVWENMVGSQIIIKGRDLYAKNIQQFKQQNPNYSRQNTYGTQNRQPAQYAQPTQKPVRNPQYVNNQQPQQIYTQKTQNVNNPKPQQGYGPATYNPSYGPAAYSYSR